MSLVTSVLFFGPATFVTATVNFGSAGDIASVINSEWSPTAALISSSAVVAFA
mgnify:CR=1 FL=1